MTYLKIYKLMYQMKQTLLGPKTQQKHDSKPKREGKKNSKCSLPNIQNREKVSQKSITNQN